MEKITEVRLIVIFIQISELTHFNDTKNECQSCKINDSLKLEHVLVILSFQEMNM